jgi:hypothetical protein
MRSVSKADFFFLFESGSSGSQRGLQRLAVPRVQSSKINQFQLIKLKCNSRLLFFAKVLMMAQVTK